uniref:Uncharacterized protein n=1 Tax=Triticum urartu TaxID=4572 RepID=A0A8R7P5Q3_TRIUA
MYYVVDDKLKDWVMGSAAKKWRDFKSELKTLYFDDKTDEELQVVPDNRVSPTDWEELVAFWKSERGKKRSQQGKQNRKEMELLHTSGSKSHARVSHEMHMKNGYPPHRHEVFMETQKCKKTGAPSSVAAANMFKKIENMENERPELLEKTIQQGGLFSHVTTKERNGYVRCKGLGPSAASLGMLGTRKLKSTKLQMAEEEAK